MNAEFHYYAIHWLCSRAGLADGEAYAIAYSSQFVDNAVHEYLIDAPSGRYRTLVTQDYVFWDERTLREVYLPFHFVPGDPAEAASLRADGQENVLAVTPNAPIARALLVSALKTRNPYRIGIALHAFADSWAHQGFSGRMEDFNALPMNQGLPAVGHLRALTAPDDLGAIWIDERLTPGSSRVVNADRFLAAARKIYRYLRTYLGKGFEDEELAMADLKGLWRPGKGREERIADLVIDADMPAYDRRAWPGEAGIRDETTGTSPFGGYDKLLWAKNEIARRAGLSGGTIRAAVGDSFFESDFYRWNEAAKAHAAEAATAIGSIA